MKNLYQKIIRFCTTQTMPSFILPPPPAPPKKKVKKREKPIFEQVLLFAGTLLPNEKIIVSSKDFKKIVECKDNYGYNVWHWDRGYRVGGFKLEKEKINSFARVELGETRTNRNFELK